MMRPAFPATIDEWVERHRAALTAERNALFAEMDHDSFAVRRHSGERLQSFYE